MPGGEDVLAQLVQGRSLVEAGVPDKAIALHFDPVIARYETAYPDSKYRVYCSTDTMQSVIFAALPKDDTQPARETVVLDSLWSDALLLKAYALVELGDYEAARSTLQQAMDLSPFNAQYANEFAYTYQAVEDWSAAIDHYRKAAEVAESPFAAQGSRNVELARAWRGEGFALIEQGKLDEAEQLFKKCLKLDRNDEKARNELSYIKELRAQKR